MLVCVYTVIQSARSLDTQSTLWMTAGQWDPENDCAGSSHHHDPGL